MTHQGDKSRCGPQSEALNMKKALRNRHFAGKRPQFVQTFPVRCTFPSYFHHKPLSVSDNNVLFRT